MRRFIGGAAILCVLNFLPAAPVEADVVYLKNGQSLEGFIAREEGDVVYLEIGCGTVGFLKREIERIYKSNHEESEALRLKWKLKRQESRLQETRAPKVPKAPETVSVRYDRDHMLVDATLNGTVKAALLLDTGSSYVVLSDGIGRKLGYTEKQEQKKAQLQMADGRKIEARVVTLEKIRVQGIEEKDVEAAILPPELQVPSTHDGLLGMSFLNRFNLVFDYKNKKVILKK